MVYFKRAEARAAIGESDRASADYKRARALFPKELWSNLAQARADHLDEQLNSTLVRKLVHKALGKRWQELNSVEESAWRAGTFVRTSPFISLELSRTALVRAVIALEQKETRLRGPKGSMP